MDTPTARQRIERLRALIDRYRYNYHVLNKSEISDDALDSLKKELFDLEQKFPDLITPDSPTQRVAGKPLEGFTKVQHPGRMISLNDAFTEQDMNEWKDRLDSYLGTRYRGAFYCDIKMDGLAMELRYDHGLLVQASTRGDGTTGEDVTQNVKTVDAVPLRLRDTERSVPARLLVRGEIFLMKSEFQRINRELASEEKKQYANPRNLAAGTIRQLDPNVTAGRKLSFYAWSVVDPDGTYGASFDTHEAEFHALRQWGIAANPHGRTVRTFTDVFAFYHEWEHKRDALDYEFDGTVISINDNATYRKAGIVGKSPRGAIAFKFSPRQAETIVEDIVVQVGRTGVLTPVAHLQPVHIGGTTVTRATLHNMDEIKRLDVKVGDTVIVGRAGDVIPDIIKVMPELRTGKERAFHMPKKCPVCSAVISKKEDRVAYYCPNKDCPAQQRERIYHFVSRGAMNIEGVGPQTVDQLMDAGLISDAADLYALTKNDLLNLDRFSDVSAQNVVDAVRERTSVSLSRFVYALGIEHVGEETARALARHFHTLENIRRASSGDLQNVPDVGPAVASSVSNWFSHAYHQRMLDKFQKAGVHIIHEKSSVNGKFSGLTFVVTGSLEAMSREEAEEKIRQHGGSASSSVSRETDYIVVGVDPGTTKMNAAEKYKIKHLNERQFLEMLRSAGDK